MDLFIQRLTKSIEIPTFGVLIAENHIPFALTLERPWRDNQRGISCIPTGAYVCGRVSSPKFGMTFQVLNVSGRQEILFHKGNIQEDSHGCILVGERFEPLYGEPGILSSQEGFDEFLRIVAKVNDFNLYIRDPQ